MKYAAKFGIAIVVVGAVIGFKFYDKGSAEAEIKASMHEWVANAPGYSSDPVYCDQLFEAAHPVAFESCYTMGGRRRGADFDDTKYVAELTQHMAARAEVDGKPEIAAGMRAMKVAYDAAPE